MNNIFVCKQSAIVWFLHFVYDGKQVETMIVRSGFGLVIMDIIMGSQHSCNSIRIRA